MDRIIILTTYIIFCEQNKRWYMMNWLTELMSMNSGIFNGWLSFSLEYFSNKTYSHCYHTLSRNWCFPNDRMKKNRLYYIDFFIWSNSDREITTPPTNKVIEFFIQSIPYNHKLFRFLPIKFECLVEFFSKLWQKQLLKLKRPGVSLLTSG